MAPPKAVPRATVSGWDTKELTHRAEDPRDSPADLLHGGFDPFSIALIVLGHLLQELGPGAQGVLLHPQGHPCLLRLPFLAPALRQFLPVPAKGRLLPSLPGEAVPGILQVLPHRLHPRLQGVLLRPQLGQLDLLTGQVGLRACRRPCCCARSAWVRWALASLARTRS